MPLSLWERLREGTRRKARGLEPTTPPGGGDAAPYCQSRTSTKWRAMAAAAMAGLTR